MKKLLLLFAAIIIAQLSMAQCNDLFFSEYVEGNYNNKALEIYNPTNSAINLAPYYICRYSNGGTSPYTLNITGTIAAHDVMVFGLDKQDTTLSGQDTALFAELRVKIDTFVCPVYTVNSTFYHNGNDAMTIETPLGTYIDIIGKIGEDPGDSWTSDTAAGFTSANNNYSNFYTKDHTLIRKPTVTQGVTSNPSYFNPVVEWDRYDKNMFDSLQTHTCDCHTQSIQPQQTVAHNFFVYPNPVVQGGSAVVKGTMLIKQVSVFNMLGQQVYFRETDGQRGDHHIDVVDFETGLYFVKIKFVDGVESSQKLIVK